MKVWLGFILIYLLAVPWYFPTGSWKPLIMGFPYWGFAVLIATLALSIYYAYVVLYRWKGTKIE